MKKFLEKYQIYIFISLFSIFIVGFDFFFKNGTYFLLDVVFTPTVVWKGFFEQNIYWHLFDFGNFVFGYKIFSKLYFFSVLFFAGILAYKLSIIFIKLFEIEKKYRNFFSYVFILFLYINPFFYERMITQTGIFLGVILLGFGLYFLLRNEIEKYKLSNFLFSGIFFGFSFSVMNHSLFMVALIYLLYFVFFVRRKKDFLALVLSGILFFLININWLIGNFFLGEGKTLSYVNVLNQANVENFYTNGLSPLGPLLTSLQLYGFWGERYHHMKLPNSINPNWYIVGFLILLIIIFGIYKFFRQIKERKILYFLLILGLISYFLALGINAPWGFISQFLYDNLPFYIGLREPHKWIGILMIIYAIFFSIGFYFLFVYLDKLFKNSYLKYLSLFFLFVFLNSWTPNVIFAFGGQLFITDYPKDYLDFRKDELKKDYKKNQYLLFPWHSYLACDWNKRITSNPLKILFYPLNIIRSDNIEVGNLYTNSSSQESKDIENFINSKDILLLKKNKITHIILLKNCSDYKKYKGIVDFLLKEDKINKVKDIKNIYLYELK